MSGELVTLRMLVVAASLQDRDLWRKGAALSTVPIELIEADTVQSLQAANSRAIDVAIIDAAVPAPERAAAIQVLRAAKPAPFIVHAGEDAAPIEGVDAAIAKPPDVKEASQLVERCVRVKLPTRVLIVDDSGTMRSIVRKILSACRYRLDVSEAAEGIAALKDLREGNFDLVFLDYNMPGLNGFETLSEIKREIPGVSVVIMTSTVDTALADRAQAAGALAFLKKPFYPADVDDLLIRHFGFQPVR